jgi:hypothetical protein
MKLLVRLVEPGARPDIALHDVSEVDADVVIQRRTTGFSVLFVQGNHGLTGFGHGMQSICAGRWLAERKDGEIVANEFQYFPAMPGNRLRHRVEIAVQKVDDVIARPVVGEPCVKSRRSQIMKAARTVVPLPRLVMPARMS